jgi:tripartite-type tricarboxylate transporter receptor subunit TctC
VGRIADTLNAALARADVKARIAALGSTVAPSSPDEYTAALRDEIGMTEKMMAAARLEAQ